MDMLFIYSSKPGHTRTSKKTKQNTHTHILFVPRCISAESESQGDAEVDGGIESFRKNQELAAALDEGR